MVANVEEEIQRAIESGSFETAIPLIEQYGRNSSLARFAMPAARRNARPSPAKPLPSCKIAFTWRA